MREAIKRIFLLVLLSEIGTYALGRTVVYGLQTEYMEHPIGIDVLHPRFGWKMGSDRYMASQKAYRIFVSDSEEGLLSGHYIYDSGKILSSLSVGIVYGGPRLLSSTRYFWKVRVWDNGNKETESAMDWFETGLIDGNWHAAKWIGSSRSLLSKYRSVFTLEYDFQIERNSHKAVFVLGAKDWNNYVTIAIDLTNKANLTIGHCEEGKEIVDGGADISGIIPQKGKYEKHHVKIFVHGPYRYDMNLEIDGEKIKNVEGQGVDDYLFMAGKRNPGQSDVYSRLYQIGFLQPQKENVMFSNICVKEITWGTTLYRDKEKHEIQGKGELYLWQPGSEISAPMLRKTFEIRKPIKKACLYATARGIYECYINGKRVGNDYYNPGWTDYRCRIMYNTYDIRSLLKEGENGVGAILGSGWYSSILATDIYDQWGVKQSFLGLIRIEYEDGTKENIVTDDTWKCYDKGPIESNSFYNGEDYDARKEVKGWSGGAFNDYEWAKAEIIIPPADSVVLQGYVGSPVREDSLLTAVSVKKAGEAYIYDLGQNMAGIPRLSGMKGRRGQEITIRCAEMLYPDIIPTNPVPPYTIDMYRAKKGQIYTENYGSALSTDHYIFRGDEKGENFEPCFTQHGFRYLSITGLETPLPLSSVQGIVLESVGKQKSSYETSDSSVNRLFENIVWGQRGNFLSVPTDCPQRHERYGWTGDAQIFSRSATYNMNVDPFYTRWMYTLRDDQEEKGAYGGFFPNIGFPPTVSSHDHINSISGGWQEVGVIVPWQVYQQYGDIRILKDHYASMSEFMEYLRLNAKNYIQPSGGFGDWLAPANTNSNLVNTAYSAYAVLIMEKIADVLGKMDDVEKYKSFYKKIKDAFNKTFVNSEGYTVAPVEMENTDKVLLPDGVPSRQKVSGREPVLVNTQTSYILPLQFGLFDEEKKDSAVRHLVWTVRESGYRLMTGFLGTPYICPVLSKEGYCEIAYKLFLQTECPSWLFPVREGATTMWERWNSYTVKNGFGPVSMNSFNHYAYGAIEEWMMSHSLGIERDENNPGYKHFFLQPETNKELEYAKGGFESVYGPIRSSWKKTGKGYEYEFSIPANTTATLFLPAEKKKDIRIIRGDKGVFSSFFKNKKFHCELGSGEYEFVVEE